MVSFCCGDVRKNRNRRKIDGQNCRKRGTWPLLKGGEKKEK
jgi:hypothetical protein